MMLPPVGPPPLPPQPPRLVQRLLGLHLVLTLCTLGLWGPVWVLMWWSADAKNAAEEQRYRREWRAYQEALTDWRWRYSLACGSPQVWAPPQPPPG